MTKPPTKLSRAQKMQLGELIAAGHRHFGSVMPRRPYADEDGTGGAGTAQFLPAHPLFMEQPIGASSDLTFLANENNLSMEEAEKRSDDLNPQLRKSLENKLGHELAYKPKPIAEARPF